MYTVHKGEDPHAFVVLQTVVSRHFAIATT